MKSLCVCLACLLLCSCAWFGGEVKQPTIIKPACPVQPDVQIPKKPEIPELSGYVRIPAGGIIKWTEKGKNANQKVEKALKVNKFGGAYLDKSCLDNVEYAFKLNKYYLDAVEAQIQTYNKGLAELRKASERKATEKTQSWW